MPVRYARGKQLKLSSNVARVYSLARTSFHKTSLMSGARAREASRSVRETRATRFEKFINALMDFYAVHRAHVYRNDELIRPSRVLLEFPSDYKSVTH